MQETPLSLKQRLEAMTNDYSHLEALYRARTGSELVLDPYGSSCSPLPELTLSASVIVPAFNSRASLEQCLIALEQSSFNRKYPEQLEVIVVDDGSSDGSWELLEQLRLALRLKALRLDHCGPSLARNAGLAYASGDVVICCDSDMILTPFSIEELVKRHQVLENVVLIGFRANVRASVRQLQADVLARNLPALLPPFLRDSRMDEMVGGWHIHICVATNHLKDLGHNRRFFLPIGAWADLPTMIWGALFSLRRSDFLALGGFSEQFQGWGHEDALLGAQAIALGNYVIPVYSAAGFHLNHADRLPDKWASSARNYHVMRRFLHTPFTPDPTRKTFPAPKALRAFFERISTPLLTDEEHASYSTAFHTAVADTYQRGKYLYSLGRYEEAATAFLQVQQGSGQEGWATFYRAQALRACDHLEPAIELLREASKHLPDRAEPLIELALALATQSRFAEARQILEQARALAPTHMLIRHILGPQVSIPPCELALLFLSQQNYAFAINEYEYALISNPLDVHAQLGRIKALRAQGKHEKAQQALTDYISLLLSEGPDVAALPIQQVISSLLEGRNQAARQLLETMRQAQYAEKQVDQFIDYINAEMDQLHPLPVASRIVEQSLKVPGDYSARELELLIALTLQAVIKGMERGDGEKLNLIEVGSGCGQATVAIGLAVQGLGSRKTQIVAVDGPSMAPRWNAIPARVILASRATAHHLDDLLVYAPEADAAPWERRSQLLLIQSKDDYQSVKEEVERYQTGLVCGGILLLHHYTDAFPQIQRFVHETLLPSAYVLVAQVDGLIAFMRAEQEAAMS